MQLQDMLLLLTVTAASSVEMVEATTIVVASGIARSWRSALEGAGLAVLVLGALVAIFGRALTELIPLNVLRMLIGTLLLLLGLQWLRKAILRSSGLKEQRDEAAIYARKVGELRAADASRGGRDATAFVMSFKGVFLEGVEVVLIVISFGASSGRLALASLGAAIAAGAVGLMGLLLARPLARIPENAMKMGVGIFLISFGTFWAGEGAGIGWPGSDLFIPVLIGVYAIMTQGLIAWLTRAREQAETAGSV